MFNRIWLYCLSVAFSIVALTMETSAQCTSPNFEIGKIEVRNFATGVRTTVICSNQTGPISVPLAATDYQVNIYTTTPAAASFPRVQLSGSADGNIVNVVIGSGSFMAGDNPPLKIWGNWAGLQTSGLVSGAKVRLYGGIEGNLTDAVFADSISRFDVGGEVSSAIQIGSLPGQLNIVEAGSVAATGRITLAAGIMHRLQVNSGNMAGDVEIGTISAAGTINNLVVATGSMSSTSSVVVPTGAIGIVSVLGGSISPTEITAKTGITAIDAGGAINSAITANANSGTGAITRLTSTSGGFAGSLQAAAISGGVDTDGIKLSGSNAHLSANITISGNAARQIDIAGNSTGTISIGGNLNTGNASRLLRVGGSATGAIAITGSVSTPVQIDALNGDLTIGGDVAIGGAITIANGLPSGKTIKIGGSLLGNVSLIPTTGLQGQVIINANNSTPPGVWTGNVTIGGSTTLTPAYYTQVSSDLGGGAVGLASFHLYETDCVPPHNQIAPAQGILQSEFTSSTPFPIRVRFYGPLKPRPADTWDDCLIVEVLDTNPLNPQCSWMNVTTGLRYRGPGDPGWTDARAIGIGSLLHSTLGTPVHPMAGVYRVRVAPGARVRCDLVNDNPDVVWPLSCAGFDAEAPAYVFRILEDCPNSQQGVPDITEIQNAANQTPSVDLDTDNDGHIDACEGVTACIDFDNNDILSIDDLFMGINLYFYGDPRADMNGAGGVTIDDYFLMINAYFSGNYGVCP